jgi:hypothetical protein
MTHHDERAEHAPPPGASHNIRNGVEAPFIQFGEDLRTDSVDADPAKESEETVASPTAPIVRNTVTGHVGGSVIQAGDVHGGLTIT